VLKYIFCALFLYVHQVETGEQTFFAQTFFALMQITLVPVYKTKYLLK